MILLPFHFNNPSNNPFNMVSWQYLLTEQQAICYKGAFPVSLSSPSGRSFTVYLPPWESAQFCMDDILVELVKEQKSQFPHMKIDSDGSFYDFSPSGANHKLRKQTDTRIQSIPKLFGQLSNNGYNLPTHYWYLNWKQLRDI